MSDRRRTFNANLRAPRAGLHSPTSTKLGAWFGGAALGSDSSDNGLHVPTPYPYTVIRGRMKDPLEDIRNALRHAHLKSEL
jgi:hypothetical protein